jgi:hypothetical protein
LGVKWGFHVFDARRRCLQERTYMAGVCTSVESSTLFSIENNPLPGEALVSRRDRRHPS